MRRHRATPAGWNDLRGLLGILLFLVVVTSSLVESKPMVLDEKILSLSENAAILSTWVCSTIGMWTDAINRQIGDEIKQGGYDIYNDGKVWVSKSGRDAALVAKKDGYCYGVFRATELFSATDWWQNIEMQGVDIDRSDKCWARKGFVDGLYTDYVHEFMNELEGCASTCVDRDECVVLTGWSQGSAIAMVASVALEHLNPYVITFGSPRTFSEGCSDSVKSERIYRYVNTMDGHLTGIGYDIISVLDGLDTFLISGGVRQRATHTGNLILLGDDAHNAPYLGLDEDYLPLGGSLDNSRRNMEAHMMITALWEPIFNTPGTVPGYVERLRSMRKSGHFPMATDGWPRGQVCSNKEECKSNKCGLWWNPLARYKTCA